jgi:hypothetical protein
MKFWQILVFVGCYLAVQWYFQWSRTPEEWLKKTCEVERERWLGKTWGNGSVRCERIMQGPGKLITYEYSMNHPGSDLDPAFESRFKAHMEAEPEYKAILGEYRSRGIAVEVNLYSSDKRLMAGLKL